MEGKSLAERTKAIEGAVRAEAERTAAYIDEDIGPLALARDADEGERGLRYVWNRSRHSRTTYLSCEVNDKDRYLFDLETEVGRSSEIRLRFPRDEAIPFTKAVWGLAQASTPEPIPYAIASLPEALKEVRDTLQERVASYVPAGITCSDLGESLSMDLNRVSALYSANLALALARVGDEHGTLTTRVGGIRYDLALLRKHGLELQAHAYSDAGEILKVTLTAIIRGDTVVGYKPVFIRFPEGWHDIIRTTLHQAIQEQTPREGFREAMRNLVPAVSGIYAAFSERLSAFEPTQPHPPPEPRG